MEPFLGQIVMFGGNFAPRSWALCNGQLLPISQNSALFSILGTTYGGDGRTTFGLPDLRGRIALHPGNGPGLSNYVLGEKGGAETTSLTVQNLPPHSHSMRANTGAGDDPNPQGRFPANSDATGEDLYADGTNADMGASSNTGNGTPHSNIQPFQCVNFIIALQGIFPSRS